MPATIREETPDDIPAIHRIHTAAFETEAEAALVDALRVNGALTLSLVAVADSGVVGHIAYSPVMVLRADGHAIAGIGLGPMAVLPVQQRAGIGSQLVTEGLRRLRAGGHRFCVVVGHPPYYPRFGFVPASRFGLRWEHEVPDPVFMVQELVAGGLAGISGVVQYRPEFDAV